MKKWSRIILTFSMMALVCIALTPSSVFSWKQRTSSNPDRPYFTTHQWLANESLNLSPSSSRVQWITNNLLDFWHGVEAPYNSAVAASYAVTVEDYGDIDDLVLYLDVTGTTVTNGSLADRAKDEYDSLVAELAKDDVDEALAAFYAGAMTHYVSQAGVWGAIWDESLWGTLPAVNWTSFEDQINAGLDASYFDDDQDEWLNTLFTTLSPTIITPVDAYDAAVDLAINIHPVAQSLGDDFENDWTEVANWTTVYEDDVIDCLTYSIEAIYAALDHAMISVNWNAIKTDDPVYTYDAITGLLEIPDFSVTFANNTGTYTLTAADAEIAEFRVIIYPENAWEDPILTPEHEDLQFNVGTQKWYHEEHLVKGTSANSDHTILYTFKMNQSSLTWSNDSALDFSVDYFKINMTSIATTYNSGDRTLDITQVIMDIYEIPEVRELEPSEVSEANWILYTKGEGYQVSEAIGVPAYDTEGVQPHGNLTYDALNQSWYATNLDIGLVFTAVRQQYYVVIQFVVNDIPVGYYKNSSYGAAEFVAACVAQDTYWFATRDHQITISIPEIVFDVETNTVDIYDITAFSDYQNTSLDYYELETKTVYGQDTRAYDWKVFLYDGIPSSVTDDLLWDFSEEYWYAEDIDVQSLPDNDYYVSAKIVNMNVNATVTPWGPASALFIISRPIPVIYWILPEFFVAGFVVLFGWLAWWRPRQKRLQIERERDAKIDKGFMD
ncbi:MAG: hypothetical protein ACTSPM_07385 [Candidatus Heimdallarchaeota archaeon]